MAPILNSVLRLTPNTIVPGLLGALFYLAPSTHPAHGTYQPQLMTTLSHRNIVIIIGITTRGT